MKALAERILKHPLKVIKCFHMPKLLAVEKNNFFLIFPEGIFPQYNHPACGKNLIQRKYCTQICLLLSLRCNKEATFVAFYSSGQTESRRFQIWQRTNILHGNEILQRRSMCVNTCFWTGASQDHLVGFCQRTILTGQGHITKVAPVNEMQQRGYISRLLQFRSK